VTDSTPDELPDWRSVQAAIDALQISVMRRPELEQAERRIYGLIGLADWLEKVRADHLLINDLRVIAEFVSEVTGEGPPK
jgi:hypothetical protein